MRKERIIYAALLILLGVGLPHFSSSAQADSLIVDHTVISEFDMIEESYFDQIRANYKIFYGHTSHGSQIISGLNELQGENSLYNLPVFQEISDDLGHNGDVSWVAPTESWLDSHADYNMVMWSWCGGCSDNSEAGINIYLDAMNQLELDYPEVVFIYMTGHLDGGGPDGNLYARNNQIRAYCMANDKILFDFADIESYDPEGNYYPNEGDGCAWCYTWCDNPDNNCADDCTCAHSHCFNCYLKGKAFWWMMARLEGWSSSQRIDMDNSIPDEYNIKQNYPNPFNSSTIIKYNLPVGSYVSIDIFNLLGRKITSLIDKEQPAGRYSIIWQADNFSSGIYFYRIKVGELVDIKKMTLIK